MRYYSDDLLFWRNYEAKKDRVFINFDKNPEMKKKFVNLITEMKLKADTEDIWLPTI